MLKVLDDFLAPVADCRKLRLEIIRKRPFRKMWMTCDIHNFLKKNLRLKSKIFTSLSVALIRKKCLFPYFCLNSLVWWFVVCFIPLWMVRGLALNLPTPTATRQPLSGRWLCLSMEMKWRIMVTYFRGSWCWVFPTFRFQDLLILTLWQCVLS